MSIQNGNGKEKRKGSSYVYALQGNGIIMVLVLDKPRSSYISLSIPDESILPPLPPRRHHSSSSEKFHSLFPLDDVLHHWRKDQLQPPS